MHVCAKLLQIDQANASLDAHACSHALEHLYSFVSYFSRFYFYLCALCMVNATSMNLFITLTHTVTHSLCVFFTYVEGEERNS